MATLQENIVKTQGKLASPLKQDTALDNSRKAFDAAQAATTPEDINVAMVKISQIDKMLKSLSKEEIEMILDFIKALDESNNFKNKVVQLLKIKLLFMKLKIIITIILKTIKMFLIVQ